MAKVSIIIPSYNSEKFIGNCLDSIFSQTHDDLEVILVDDCSTDHSYDIMKSYEKREPRRLKVVRNPENKGAAGSRNVGLDIADGKYIGFVDSDDYIKSDMYELLYDICINNNCEIASCSSTIYFKDKTVVNGGHDLIIHEREEAMKTMLEGRLYDEVVWVKLFKRELFDDVKFPVGKIYEDTAVTYKLIDKSNRVGCIGKAKYNYIKREGIVMDNAIKNIRLDAIDI